MYQKNEIIRVTIQDLGAEGEGIGKVDGFPLFVKDALPGDVVDARILKAKKNYAYAKVERVITPSSFRIPAICPDANRCGGCQIQMLSYEKQLEFKSEKVKNNLIRIGGIEKERLEAVFEPIISMECRNGAVPMHYRNKAQFPFGKNKAGETVCGFYAGRTHSIIANTRCGLGIEENEKILEIILDYMKTNHVEPYEETTGKGLIRHVLIRKGFQSGEIMVCLVINGKELPKKECLVKALTQVEGMKSISISVNQEKNNVILGKSYRTIWGSDTIRDSIFRRDGSAVEFCISPLSFYQVNPVQTEKLYATALEYAQLTGEEIVWDLYCGIGTISLFLAKDAKMVCGVEIVPQAIADAEENARRNQISNARFFVGKAEEVLPDFYEGKDMNAYRLSAFSAQQTGARKTSIGLASEMKEAVALNEAAVLKEGAVLHDAAVLKEGAALHESKVKKEGATADSLDEFRTPDVICVDPPRKGCDEMCLKTMVIMQPKRIVYVSCDSATLARDVKYLEANGYRLERVRPCDMFPNTVHVESVVLITRKEK